MDEGTYFVLLLYAESLGWNWKFSSQRSIYIKTKPYRHKRVYMLTKQDWGINVIFLENEKN